MNEELVSARARASALNHFGQRHGRAHTNHFFSLIVYIKNRNRVSIRE